MVDQRPKIIAFLFVFKLSRMGQAKDIGIMNVTRNITQTFQLKKQWNNQLLFLTSKLIIYETSITLKILKNLKKEKLESESNISSESLDLS